MATSMVVFASLLVLLACTEASVWDGNCVDDQCMDVDVLLQVGRYTRVQARGATYVRSTKIPCYIHQTWKTNDVSQLEHWMQNSVKSFRDFNPDCKHKIWSDEEVDQFMQANYVELMPFWPGLKPVEKADLFRYAVVHKLGGFYADMDVLDLKPISQWEIPDDVGLLVGYETGWHIKEDTRRHVRFSRNEQFEQWFFGAEPEHPALKQCLDLFQRKRQWGIEDTIELTGPALFSDSVHEYFWQWVAKNSNVTVGEALRSVSLREAGSEEMTFPPGKGPAGSHVLILSANQVAAPGFSAGMITDDLLIRHMFEGSWKTPDQNS